MTDGSGWELIEGDCLAVMRAMPDNSADLIATDPPYFRVKGEAWDNQWESADRFLAWMGELAEQWQRILRPNGSLYVFASPKMASRVECEIAKRFAILNNLIWVKDSAIHRRACKEELRAFFPQTERIIFAEHFGAELRAYIAGEFDRAGMLNTAGKIAANVACGFSPSAGGMASRHYFSQSQWQLPTAAHYAALRALLNSGGGDYLRREYEDLRRPFAVTPAVPYTDVWDFPTVQRYAGKHPCEKPLALMEHIVTTSSRPGGVVFDCFAGSGSTGVAALRQGRRFVGVERCPRYCDSARARLQSFRLAETPDMFDAEGTP